MSRGAQVYTAIKYQNPEPYLLLPICIAFRAMSHYHIIERFYFYILLKTMGKGLILDSSLAWNSYEAKAGLELEALLLPQLFLF